MAYVPNLDAMMPEELREWELIFARLACYAGHKKDAVRLRLAGDIEAALASERCADHQYKLLPADVRW